MGPGEKRLRQSVINFLIIVLFLSLFLICEFITQLKLFLKIQEKISEGLAVVWKWLL